MSPCTLREEAQARARVYSSISPLLGAPSTFHLPPLATRPQYKMFLAGPLSPALVVCLQPPLHPSFFRGDFALWRACFSVLFQFFCKSSKERFRAHMSRCPPKVDGIVESLCLPGGDMGRAYRRKLGARTRRELRDRPGPLLTRSRTLQSIDLCISRGRSSDCYHMAIHTERERATTLEQPLSAIRCHHRRSWGTSLRGTRQGGVPSR